MTEPKKACCANCKFAASYDLPMEPEPTGFWFFGLIPKTMSRVDQITNEVRDYKNKNKVYCYRFPQGVEVSKQYKCGEYVEAK